MLVTPPGTPTRATGAIEALLDALGFPALEDLDEDSEGIAEHHQALFEEVSAFARRGWVTYVCFESDSYSAKEYATELRRALRPLGIAKIKFDDKGGLVTMDKITYQVDLPSQARINEGHLDDVWFFDVANRAAGEAGFVVAKFYEGMSAYVAVVPHAAWSAVAATKLEGTWFVIPPVEHAFD
jgi:hypothetical protein